MLCDLWGIKDTFNKPTKPETTKETPKSATECTDTPNNTSSSPSVVAKKWTEIETIVACNKSVYAKKYSEYTKVMKYDTKCDCIICDCGEKIWVSNKRPKPSDLGVHLGAKRHSQWLKSIRERKQGFIKGWTARTRKALSDITRNVLHYQFLYATFVCVWFIVSYQLSLRLIGAFNALLLFLGVSCSGGSYLHKINDMVRAFYLVRFAQLTYLINQSNWFALSFDESTSKVCSKSYLSIVIAYRDRAAHKNRNHFMKLKPLFSGDAATITQAILSFLNDDLGVDGDRFVCVTGDNCSTNTGSISGVFVRLIAVFTALFSMGCMAHRLALVISGALFLLSYFVALEKIIRRLITWARASPKRAGELTAAANEIEEKAKQVGVMHRIRWLSRENVSKTIYESKHSILSVLKKEAEEEKCDAMWLYPRLQSIYFWLLFCLFIDILCVLGILQRHFQGDFVYSGKCSQRVNETKEALTARLNIEERGYYTNDFIDEVRKGKFTSHGMCPDSIDETCLGWLRLRYDETKPVLMERIDHYFPLESMQLCDSFSIFSPSTMLSQRLLSTNQSAFLRYGDNEIKRMAKQLHRPGRPICVLDALNEWYIIRNEMRDELRRSKRNHETLTDELFWKDRMIEYDEHDMNCQQYTICLMYDATLRVKCNSSINERSFLTMNDTKTKKRNRISDAVLDWLCFLVMSGWRVWSNIPWKKVVATFIKNSDISLSNKRQPAFNQNYSFKQFEQSRPNDWDNTIQLKNSNKSSNVSAAFVEDILDDLPMLNKDVVDFIPKDFMDLVPSQGAVLENECKDDEFLCEHTWKTVKDDVLKCIDCGDLCCVMCLNSCFKVRKCEITKMRQKKIPFTCVTCQVNEMSKKRTSKRKRKRRKKT